MLFRETNDDTLPIALPPLEMHLEPHVIDEIYSAFTDREDVQFLLYSLGYRSRTTKDFKSSGLTDNEIRKLIMESKKVTVEQIRELLSRASASPSVFQCMQCGKHVSEEISFWGHHGMHDHRMYGRKGKVYCWNCWHQAHPHCYIATAAYGTPMANELRILREFRNKKLKSKRVGKHLVNLYYRTSPPIAHIISRNEKMKVTVRYALNPIIRALKRHSTES